MRPIRVRIGTLAAFFIFVAALAGMSVHAQTAAAPAEQATLRPSSIIDQRALDLLKDMSSTLGAAKQFTYRSLSSVEAPVKTGQFVTVYTTSEVAVKRPDKVRIRAAGEIPTFNFFYNGTTVSVFSPAADVYSITPAPNTIDAMLPFIEERANINLPSADILFSNPYAMMTRDLTTAFVVGPAMVQGVPCRHVAFRGQGINWEIWIASGAQPLPMRLAATYTDVQNFPRFLVEFSDWNLRPTLDNSYFAFQAPTSAEQVAFGSQLRRGVFGKNPGGETS